MSNYQTLRLTMFCFAITLLDPSFFGYHSLLRLFRFNFLFVNAFMFSVEPYHIVTSWDFDMVKSNSTVQSTLVGGLEHGFHFPINILHMGRIIPTDFHIFPRAWYTTNQHPPRSLGRCLPHRQRLGSNRCVLCGDWSLACWLLATWIKYGYIAIIDLTWLHYGLWNSMVCMYIWCIHIYIYIYICIYI